jgi:hypothetical protein
LPYIHQGFLLARNNPIPNCYIGNPNGTQNGWPNPTEQNGMISIACPYGCSEGIAIYHDNDIIYTGNAPQRGADCVAYGTLDEYCCKNPPATPPACRPADPINPGVNPPVGGGDDSAISDLPPVMP